MLHYLVFKVQFKEYVFFCSQNFLFSSWGPRESRRLFWGKGRTRRRFYKFASADLFFSRLCSDVVEMRRIELLTPCLQGRCSPSWATPPSGVSLRFSPLQYFVKALRHTLSIVFIALPCLVKAGVTYCFGLSSALWLLNRCVNFAAVCIFFAIAVCFVHTIKQKNSKCTKFGGPKWTRTTDLTLIRRAL